MSKNQGARRSEQAGMFHFMREMGSALVMALIAIVYVIQAFKIPTGSMENSLLVGDFLLGLKFIYGAPIMPYSRELGINQRLPAVSNPKPGDVVIFKYPGADNKDYIKRCVAGPGSTLQINDKELIVDGKVLNLPPRGKFVRNGDLDHSSINHFAPLYIPKKGDTIKPSSLALREFLYFKHLIHQENPRKKITVQYQLYLNGTYSNHRTFPLYGTGPSVTLIDLHENRLEGRDPRTGRRSYFNLNNIDNWTELDMFLNNIKALFANEAPEFRYSIFMDGKPVDSYKVRYDNYFMMGDNRDNSLDSRYWGYVNFNYVKAKAFILYFSLDETTPYWQLPLKIRWERIGRLIRSWDGVNPTPGVKW